MKCFDRLDNIFFDFDGTLCDTEADIRDSWRAAFAELKLDATRFERLYRIGPPTEVAAQLFFPGADDAFLRRLCEVYRGHYYGSGYPKTRAYPGVDAMLGRLRAEGKKLFIATNKNAAPLTEIVGKLGWSGVFVELLNRDMMPLDRYKKSELLRQALERHALDPRRTAMVGDAATDIAAGREAGVVTVAADYGYGDPDELAASGADRVLTLKEVREYL